MLEPVRRSYFSGEPMPWNRVHLVPDFVYFNHAVHVTAARVTCVECHGDVSNEPLVERARLFTMGWCLDCHRQHEAEAAARGAGERPAGDDRLPPVGIGWAPTLLGTSRITTCTTCHR